MKVDEEEQERQPKLVAASQGHLSPLLDISVGCQAEAAQGPGVSQTQTPSGFQKTMSGKCVSSLPFLFLPYKMHTTNITKISTCCL